MNAARYIVAGADVFELRWRRKAILWTNGKAVNDHDYGRLEIIKYLWHGDWREVDEAEGKRLIAEQTK